jgi:tetratricopeptide (TPR) repeat protein
VCLLVFLVGCRRSTNTTEPQGGTVASRSDDTGGDPSQARAFLEKGRELYRNDEDSQAVEAFQQALKLDPNLAEAHFRLGLSYEALDKAEEAEAAYKKAVETYKEYLQDNPEDAEAHYNLGQSYAALHLYSEAVREYRQATRLKEDDSDVYYDLGMALTRLAQYDEAVGAFAKSLEIDPENYRAQDGLDEAREGVKRIKAGKKHQEELLKKQKEEELKKLEEGITPQATPSSKKP